MRARRLTRGHSAEEAANVLLDSLRNQLDRNRHRSYGVHSTDPYTTPANDHRVDFYLSVDFDVAPNAEEMINKGFLVGRGLPNVLPGVIEA